ncbi:Nif3-like dinuclear metal center hexameric protein, partial [Clostridium perfringens]
MKKVKDIINIMEEFAPVTLKEDFDNVGLMVGDKEKSVKKILLA